MSVKVGLNMPDLMICDSILMTESVFTQLVTQLVTQQVTQSPLTWPLFPVTRNPSIVPLGLTVKTVQLVNHWSISY